MMVRFLLGFFVRFETFDYLVRLPLGPREVVVRPLVVVAHRPPKPILETRPHLHRVVAAANVVLVRCEGRDWESGVSTVRFVDFRKKGAVVPLLQVEVLLFVLGIGQILGKQLDLCQEAFERVVRGLDLLLLDQVLLFWGFAQTLTLLRLLGRQDGRLLSGRLLKGFEDNFFVHPSLNDEQTRRYE